MFRSRRRIVPSSQLAQQGRAGSPLIIQEVTEPILTTPSHFRVARVRVPVSSVDYEDETEPEPNVVYVRSTPVKSQTRIVHVLSPGTNSRMKRPHESQDTEDSPDENTYHPEKVGKVENERVFITTPVTKVENERVFIPSPVSKVENERVFVTTPEPKVVLERVYIPHPLANIDASAPPSNFAGAAKNDALTASGKAPIAADGSASMMPLGDNNVSGNFQ